MHVIEPFLPDLVLTADHSAADTDTEIQALYLVQRYIAAFLRGEMSLDDLNEALFEFGIDPNDYWGTVEESVEAVIESGQRLEDIDLILPWSNQNDEALCLIL